MAPAVLFILAGVLVAPAFSGDPGAPANQMCPVMPDEPVDPNYWVKHGDRTIWFCCKKCKTQFLADPEAYVSNLPPAEAAGAGSSPKEHDHSTGHGAESPRARWVVVLGRLHVVSVHFPIAFLLLAAGLELASLRSRWRRLGDAVRPLVGFGALFSIGAAGLGLIHGLDAAYRGNLLGYFEWHRALGLVTVAGAVIAWILVERRRRDATQGRILAARIAIVALGILVGIVGHLGGALVFGPDFLVP